MTATLVAAPAPDDGDERTIVVQRELCVCGRLAEIVVVADDVDVTVAVRCRCASFAPANGSAS